MYELIDVNIEKKMNETLHYTAKNLSETGHNSKPVLLHSFKVSMMLYTLGYSEEIIISSILHDLLEDTNVEYQDINKKYGSKIADIVNAVSFNPKIEDKLQQAKEMYQKCCDFGFDALIVKCADLLDNINYVNLVEDIKIKTMLLKKYGIFLSMSKAIIGKEKIYKLLESKYKKHKSL